MNDEQKKLAIEIGAGLLALVAIFAIIYFGTKGKQGVSNTASNGTSTKVLGQDAFRPDNVKALATVEGGTRETISETIATPEVGAKNVPANVAVPVGVVPQKFTSYRKYAMTGNNGVFSPSTFVIDERDNVEIAFTAVDADYNFSISDWGVTQNIKKGETGTVMFQGADFGQFKITCKATVCKNEQAGTLIVNKRP